MNNGIDISIKFGRRIKQIRENKHISQDLLGEMCGLHRTYIGMIERAERNVSIQTIQKLADALGISICDLLKDL